MHSLGIALLVSLMTAMAWAPRVMAARRSTRHSAPHAPRVHVQRAARHGVEADAAGWTPVHVRPGETLSGIFKAHGYSAAELARLLAAAPNRKPLENLHPGEVVWLKSGTRGRLDAIRCGRSPAITVAMRQPPARAAETTPSPPPAGPHVAWGRIHGTLFTAAARKKVPPFLIAHLAGMFKQVVDFRDLQKGGYFAVIYRDQPGATDPTAAAHILAAEIHTSGHSVAAYRFKPAARPAAYYTAEGVPLRRPTLLRYPTTFTHLSSPFGMRVDPVVHRYQLHQGIDLAAPIGTPVRAAGNGVITYRGWSHGYGEYITIRNTATYTTGYAHLAGFVPGQHVGSRVRQGEVIGYVGNTGWSTGPHLEYETFVDGQPVNPLTVAAPDAVPLAGAVLAAFRHETARLVARVRRINAHIARLQTAGVTG